MTTAEKNSLEELLEHSDIKFPVPLSVKELLELFGHVAKNMPANVSYEHKVRTDIIGLDYDGEEIDFKTVKEEPGSTKGNIYNRKSAGGIFCVFYEDARDAATGISFQTIPGYSLAEHSPDYVKLWDDTRRLVDNYFSSRKA